MKYVKMPDKKEVHEIAENTLNVYQREGFIECDKAGKPIKEEKIEE
jgi:hypothetical protein